MTSTPSPTPSGDVSGGVRIPSHVQVLMQAVEGIVIIRGPAGSAALLAAAIDAAALVGVLATVAGNDTTLVILRPGSAVEEAVRALRCLLVADSADRGQHGDGRSGTSTATGPLASARRVQL